MHHNRYRKKQIKNKTRRVVIKYPNKNWTSRNAKWTSDSTSKPKASCVGCEGLPCTERHQSFQGDVSYPKMHYTHLAHFSSVHALNIQRAEFWHSVVTPVAKAENQESSQTFREGSSGGWGKTWKYPRFLLRKSTNLSLVKRRSQLTMWQAQASFGTCVTENNVVTCPQLSRQAAVKVYLHQWPLEQQLGISYPRESLLASCKAAQVQLLLNRDTR